MPEAQFIVEIADVGELMPSGCDRVRFVFTANSRMAVQPIEKIASGGELSRVMLALKTILAQHLALPTIIFDEIDTGVSGRIADAMGDIIARLAESMQIVDITHLPQVAARGQHHYLVYKEDTAIRTETHIRQLSAAEHDKEIEKMRTL